jgi:hypothetical protein
VLRNPEWPSERRRTATRDVLSNYDDDPSEVAAGESAGVDVMSSGVGGGADGLASGVGVGGTVAASVGIGARVDVGVGVGVTRVVGAAVVTGVAETVDVGVAGFTSSRCTAVSPPLAITIM